MAADPAISNSHVMKMLSAMLRSSYDVRPCSCLPFCILTGTLEMPQALLVLNMAGLIPAGPRTHQFT